MRQGTDRRHFLQTTLAAGSAWALTPSLPANAAQPVMKGAGKPAAMETVRVGLVGAGDRGTYLLTLLLAVEKVEVRAICDVVESKVARAQRLVEEHRQPKPTGYHRTPTDYRDLCRRNDLDLVINATPWALHTSVALAAMAAGKHVATEVPAAATIEECWQQVEAAEKTRRHCVMLENYCYQRDVMMVLNLIRKGLFGEIMHAEGGYQKDGRDYELRVNADGSPSWQTAVRKGRQGNPFPTHDAGPLALWLDINRGDRFEYLVSMGGNSRGFNEYGAKYLGPDSPSAKTRFEMADINASLIHTAKGRTIYLVCDTVLSRPQPRNVYRLMGSRGIFDRTSERLFLEEKSPKRDRTHGDWEPVAKYYEEFDHPLWKALRANALGAGRSGPDFLCVYRLIRALRTGTAPDMDVYDAATWSSIVELTDTSARKRSLAVDFPDFTRGRWKTTPPAPLSGG